MVRSSEARVYGWALRATGVATLVVGAAGAAIGWFVADAGGLFGALAGALVGGGTAAATQWAMLIAHRKRPETFGAIVGGVWLGKMVVLVALLAGLTRVESLHRGTFGGVVLVLVAVTLGIDLIAARRARLPYVTPGSGPGSQ